jgi:hypothetical protein
VKVRIKNKSRSNIKLRSESILVQFISINENDIIYDLDKIKNGAKKAKESFEKRCLDQILKKLVNEHFEW